VGEVEGTLSPYIEEAKKGEAKMRGKYCEDMSKEKR